MMKLKNKLMSISLATIVLVAMVAVTSLSASAAPTVKAATGSAPALWSIGGVAPGIAVVSGTAADGTVYCSVGDGGPWTSISKPSFVTIAGDPAACVGAAGLYVFVKDSTGQLWYTVRQNAIGFVQITAWTKVGSITLATGTSPGAYCLPAPGDVNVLYVDPTTNALKHTYLSGGSWSTPDNLGGYISATPGAAVTGNIVDVFVRGQSGGLWTCEGATGGFSGWTEVPGHGYLAPGTGPSAAVGAVATGSVDVFVEGGSGGLWYQHYDVATSSWNTGSVTGWRLVGGVLTGSPSATCFVGNVIGVIVKGADDNLWDILTIGPYVGPPVPPVVNTAGWPWSPWMGPVTNVP